MLDLSQMSKQWKKFTRAGIRAAASRCRTILNHQDVEDLEQESLIAFWKQGYTNDRPARQIAYLRTLDYINNADPILRRTADLSDVSGDIPFTPQSEPTHGELLESIFRDIPRYAEPIKKSLLLGVEPDAKALSMATGIKENTCSQYLHILIKSARQTVRKDLFLEVYRIICGLSTETLPKIITQMSSVTRRRSLLRQSLPMAAHATMWIAETPFPINLKFKLMKAGLLYTLNAIESEAIPPHFDPRIDPEEGFDATSCAAGVFLITHQILDTNVSWALAYYRQVFQYSRAMPLKYHSQIPNFRRAFLNHYSAEQIRRIEAEAMEELMDVLSLRRPPVDIRANFKTYWQLVPEYIFPIASSQQLSPA